MTITERTLRNWRKQALEDINYFHTQVNGDLEKTSHRKEMAERVLRLTQELLDQYLLKK